jgi:hypothetical protein
MSPEAIRSAYSAILKVAGAAHQERQERIPG